MDVIKETCGCGATVEAPANKEGYEYIVSWRNHHKHDKSAEAKETPFKYWPQPQPRWRPNTYIVPSTDDGFPYG